MMDFGNQEISITGRHEANFKKALSFFFFPGENKGLGMAATVKFYSIDPVYGLIFYWTDPHNYSDKPMRICREEGDLIEQSGRGKGRGWEEGEYSVEVIKLPFPMACPAACDFAWHWYIQSEVDGKQPDIDGDVQKAWKIFNEEWCHVAGHSQALVAIKPIWAMFGK